MRLDAKTSFLPHAHESQTDAVCGGGHISANGAACTPALPQTTFRRHSLNHVTAEIFDKFFVSLRDSQIFARL